MSVLYEYNSSKIGFHHTFDEVPQKKDFRMHAHDHYEILYFVSGKGELIIEGNSYSLTKDCIFIMRPAEVHNIQISSDEPYERIVVYFTKEILENGNIGCNLTEAFDDRPLGQNNKYENSEFDVFLFKKLLDGMKTPGDKNAKQDAILCNLMPILFKLFSLFKENRNKETKKTKNLSTEIISFVNGHISEPLSLDRLSNRYFISKSQLNRLFKNSTGTSVWEYIILKRLIGARELIRSGLPVIKASQNMGFSDYSAFYRAYKKKFGISPKDESMKYKNGGEKL